MSELATVLILLLGFFVVGVALFFPMRWLLTRNNPASKESPKVTPSGYLQMALVVSALLVLIWYKEAGSKIAIVTFGILALVASVWGVILARKSKR